MSAESVQRYDPIPLPLPRGGGAFERINGYWYTSVHGALVVTPQPGTPRLTVDDVPELPADYRDEIIEGRLIATPGPVFAHQRIGLKLAMLLEQRAPEGWRARRRTSM